MRKTYHCSHSSHDEVMARSEEDLDRMFNCFAEAVIQTGSRAIADAELTTHNHSCVQTDDVKRFTYLYRYGYSRFFNSKYSRSGRLGERQAFCTELSGARRIATCASYIKRQGLHHGLSETAFGYSHCSSNVLFQKHLGKQRTYELMPEKSRYKHLTSNADFYEGYRMDSSGLLLREDVIDVAYGEELYVTPKNFLYQMTRYSDENWVAEQKEEDPLTAPVTLEGIEKNVPDMDVNSFRSNERGRVDYNIVTDIDLCTIIDSEYVPDMYRGVGSPSIYLLSDSQKAAIGNQLWSRFNAGRARNAPLRVTKRQLERCLCMRAGK